MYRFYDTPLTWNNAKLECEKEGSRLAISAESDLCNFWNACLLEMFWIGASKQNQDGKWMWLDGRNVSSWFLDEPESIAENSCLAAKQGQLNSSNCNSTFKFMCQGSEFLNLFLTSKNQNIL